MSFCKNFLKSVRYNRYQANLEHLRRSQPDSGVGLSHFQFERSFKPFKLCSSGGAERAPITRAASLEEVPNAVLLKLFNQTFMNKQF